MREITGHVCVCKIVPAEMSEQDAEIKEPRWAMRFSKARRERSAEVRQDQTSAKLRRDPPRFSEIVRDCPRSIEVEIQTGSG